MCGDTGAGCGGSTRMVGMKLGSATRPCHNGGLHLSSVSEDIPRTLQIRYSGCSMPVFHSDSIRRTILIIAAMGMFAPSNFWAEVIDYHQHLYSPQAGARSSPGPKGIDADYLVAQLDAAGISRAVVLSVAYSFSNPNKTAVPDEYAHVMMENNWTSEQVAKYPQRLLGFCSVNPLRRYALSEIARCAKDPNLRTGLKLHFGNSDVNLDSPEDLARVRRVFRAANEHHMAIVVHLHANIDHHRPYGAREARIFLEKLLPEAPDVVVQIAHLAGGGGYDDPATDAALSVFVKAIERKDHRMKNVYFDVCGIAILGIWEDKVDLLVSRIRQIGTNRLLYGSETADNMPAETLKRWHSLPLTQDEFRKVDNNVAPYLRRWMSTANSQH
jgi:predicted TIM-barrel fold metal-dependent hydrolase